MDGIKPISNRFRPQPNKLRVVFDSESESEFSCASNITDVTFIMVTLISFRSDCRERALRFWKIPDLEAESS